jgi:hypothetical protein
MVTEVPQSMKSVMTPMDIDLAKSGLTARDIMARPISNSERAATKTPGSTDGYVIPYFDMFGRPLAHYRVRCLSDMGESLGSIDPGIGIGVGIGGTGKNVAKYRQPVASSTHLYFPRGFYKLTNPENNILKRRVIFITEGEKKAALACKLGLPCVALGGVDAWRNRVIQMPGDPQLAQRGSDAQGTKKLIARLDSGAETSEESYTSSLAVGMQDLIDLVLQTDTTIIIVFDSDVINGVKPSVQRAAANLGFEFRFKGVPFTNIRQIILPFNEGHSADDSDADADADAEFDKLGLDDFLTAEGGYESFVWLVNKCLEKRSAFPRHPSIMDYVGRRLQKAKMSRKEAQQVALAIMTELDSTGIRLRSEAEKQMYYFDNNTKVLMKAAFLVGLKDEAHETPFGSFLYRRFGVGAADQKMLQWLSAQFAGELPIENVIPERIFAYPKRVAGQPPADCVRYQINDGQYVIVNSDGIEIVDNGHDNVLFEKGYVEPIQKNDLIREFHARSREPLYNWWDIALRDTRIKDHNYTQQLHALLYYISPWLFRWRGLQLPIEMTLGESGSGKSTLYSLRQQILTGDPKLRNSPADMKDWVASVVNAGGLHVIDNVQMTNPQLRNLLSDELCRLVTEPNPSIEQRKYYTNADILRHPVRVVFAITAIRQPFQNADLMQRSVVLELDKPAQSEAVTYSMDWVGDILDAPGGRTAWVAHHLYVLHKFFQVVKQEWNPNYIATHRLVHFEQSLCLMAKVFGMDSSWIPRFLVGKTNVLLTKTDWAFEGLRAFVEERQPLCMQQPYFFASDVVDWAQSEPDFSECEILTSSRRYGRWMEDHKSMINQILNVQMVGKYGNKSRYRIFPFTKAQKEFLQTSGTLTETISSVATDADGNIIQSDTNVAQPDSARPSLRLEGRAHEVLARIVKR